MRTTLQKANEMRWAKMGRIKASFALFRALLRDYESILGASIVFNASAFLEHMEHKLLGYERAVYEMNKNHILKLRNQVKQAQAAAVAASRIHDAK